MNELYRALGRSGLCVSRLIIGSTMFGEIMDAGAARAVLHRAWDLGVHTIDTGDIYAGGCAEEVIGDLISARRQQLVLCTKVGFRVGDTPADHFARWQQGIAPHGQGLSRRHIMNAVEASLRRLRTDFIDLYQIHRWDPFVPIEETLRALDDLIRSGKVRYIGCSNARSWQLYEALWTSDRRNLPRFESMQVPYSLLNSGPEQDVLPACAHAQVSAIAYSALGGGALTGRHADGIVQGSVMAQRPAYQASLHDAANRRRLADFATLATQAGRSQTELALGSILAHPAVAAATVGVQDPEELKSLVAAASSPLEQELIDKIRAIFA